MEQFEMLVKMLFEQAWTATHIEVLNFGFTYWDMIIGVFVVTVSLRIINHLFGGIIGDTDDVGGNSRNVRISKDRRDDEI